MDYKKVKASSAVHYEIRTSECNCMSKINCREVAVTILVGWRVIYRTPVCLVPWGLVYVVSLFRRALITNYIGCGLFICMVSLSCVSYTPVKGTDFT